MTVDDINVAEEIFGKDIFALKGETTRQSSFAVTMDTIEMPLEIAKLQNDTFLGINIFHINGLVFFIAVSLKIKLFTTEEMKSENVKTILECIKSAVKIHNKRNLCIAMIAGNDEFDSLKNILKEKLMRQRGMQFMSNDNVPKCV